MKVRIISGRKGKRRGSRNIDTELVCRALGNALHRKRKNEAPIFHSDRGSQYSSNHYQAMLAQNKIKGSMSKAGYPYDNSPMVSFFASLKKEYFYRREYATIQDVERDLFYYGEDRDRCSVQDRGGV